MHLPPITDIIEQMSTCAQFRFYEELNDFLPPERKKNSFEYCFEGTPAVKHLIESLGVPHTEVDLILVNGETVDFSHKIHQGDRVSVYPLFESLDISGVSRLRSGALRAPAFILDVHLGKLAKYLRLLGFDSLYKNTYTDEDIAGVIREDPRRIVLTRDRGLLKRKIITHGYWVRETDSRKQLDEILTRFDLFSLMRPFTLCIRCNEKVVEVEKDSIYERLPGEVRKLHDDFTLCPRCKRIYWPGSHYDRMSDLITHVRSLSDSLSP